MKTRHVQVRGSRPALETVRALGRDLSRGGFVVFPTETVYGIAAAAEHPTAVDRLVALKGRPPGKRFTIHVPRTEDVAAYAAPLSPVARRLADRLWPGPLTLVLPDREEGYTGFRLPDHPVARDLLSAAGEPVVATSANLSGEPAAVTAEQALDAFEGKVEAIVTAGTTRYQAPSTVVRVTGREIEVLREGVLPEAEIRRASLYTVLFVCTGNLCRSPMAEAMFRTRLEQHLGTTDLEGRGLRILSAGTGALAGLPATPTAVRAAASHGGDLDAHSSRPLTPSLLVGADRIYVAEEHHARVIRDFAPEAAPRIRPLLSDGRSLPDPFGGSEEEYRETAERIAAALGAVVEEVLEEWEGGDPRVRP